MASGKPRDDEGTSALWRASGMGAELAASIVGMVLIGWLIDRWLGTTPIAVLVGAGMGFVGGGYNFWKSAQKMNREAAAQYKRSRPGPSDTKDGDDRTES